MPRAPRFRTVVMISLAAGLLAASDGDARASALAEASISQGVVRVINRLGNENSIGSGTLVERHQETGIILTCAHLFSDGVGDLVVFFDGQPPRHALVIAIDKKNDLASLAVQPPPTAPVRVAATVPPPGAELASCGFGQQGKFRANHGRCLGQVTLEHGETSGVLEITGAARQGDSGGPIFDAGHQLVGVIMGSNGDVVDGTHCGVMRDFLARQPLTADLARQIAQLSSRPVHATAILFRPDFGAASESPSSPPALATVRGIVRYNGQPVSGASIRLSGTRTTTLDRDGRFVFQDVASGHYELNVDTVIHNKRRHAQRSIWVSSEADEQEFELKFR